MIRQAIRLIKKEYMLNNNIKDVGSVSFELHSRKPSGEYVFIVKQGNDISSYVHNRIDLSPLTGYEGLTLDNSLISPQGLSKVELINHIKNKIGYLLLTEDISFITLSKGLVTVGIARDSMCYSGDFSFKRS